MIRVNHFFVLVFLLLISIVIFYIPIVYECDAASFLNFAKFIARQGGAPSEYRMPGYPLYLLIVGGLSSPGLLFVIVSNVFLACATTFLFYRLCALYLGSKSAWIASFIVLLTSLFLYTAKMALTEPVYIFLNVALFYYFSKLVLQCSEINRWQLASLAFIAICLIFVRYEGVIPVAFVMAYIFLSGKSTLRDLAIATLLILSTLFSYSLARAYVAQSSDAIGSVQNGTGRQLLWRIYTEDYGITNRIPGDHETASRLPHGASGSALWELKELISDAYTNNPEWILEQRTQFDSGEQFAKYYGNFLESGDRAGFANFIFNADLNQYTAFYPSYITKVVYKAKGIFDGDRFLKDVVLEVVIARPYVLLEWADSMLSFYNVGMLDVMKIFGVAIQPDSTGVADQRGLLEVLYDTYSTHFHYIDTGYDLAGCATSTLGRWSKSFYGFDRRIYESVPYRTTVHDYLSVGRNLARQIFGPMFLISMLVMIYVLTGQRNSRPMFTIGLATLASSALYGVLAGGAHSRYEIVILPFAILITIYVLGLFRNYIIRSSL